jgi:DNA-binding NarL/FixJ family response regulator
MAGSGIKVVIGEDHPIFLDGLVHVLESGGFEVMGTANNAPDLVRLISQRNPKVVIADIQMPPDRTDDGLRAVLEARNSQPELTILLLSQFLEARYALELIGEEAAGVGYLLKDKVADISEFADAVRRVSEGATVLDPEVVALLVSRPRTPGPLDELTKRERAVLELIAEGHSNTRISRKLFVSVGAVERHVAHIYSKLGLREGQGDHRRVLAVLRYLEQ